MALQFSGIRHVIVCRMLVCTNESSAELRLGRTVSSPLVESKQTNVLRHRHGVSRVQRCETTNNGRTSFPEPSSERRNTPSVLSIQQSAAAWPRSNLRCTASR